MKRIDIRNISRIKKIPKLIIKRHNEEILNLSKDIESYQNNINEIQMDQCSLNIELDVLKQDMNESMNNLNEIIKIIKSLK